MGYEPQGRIAGFEAETDADLLLYMSMSAEEPESARLAWEAFYLRHVRYLYAVCLRAYAPLLGGAEGVGDLVAETFRRAYEHAGTFDAAEIHDAERLRRRAAAWLGRIAQRLVQDILRGRRKLPVHGLDAAQWREVAAEPVATECPTPQGREKLETLKSALATLSEKEQLVLRVTFQWYEPGAEHQRLSDEVCADLARQLQTTGENLRQIRRRALKKVEHLVRQHRGEPGEVNPRNMR